MKYAGSIRKADRPCPKCGFNYAYLFWTEPDYGDMLKCAECENEFTGWDMSYSVISIPPISFISTDQRLHVPQNMTITFMQAFPRSDDWDRFIEKMKYYDVWYDILDSEDIGKILDYMYEIMAWAKLYGHWGKDNLRIIEEVKAEHAEDYEE